MAKINYQATYNDTLFSAYLLEISSDGSCARVQRSVDTRSGEDLSPRNPRWQEIKYTRRGDPYVRCRGRRLRLSLFMRTL